MQKRSNEGARRSLLLTLFVLALVTVVAILPYQFGSEAADQKGKGLFTRTESADPSLPNYDIRTAKGDEIADFFEAARSSVGKNAVAVADVRDGFVRGEEALKSRLPQVKFEYNDDIRIPEVITPDVWKTKIEYLSSASSEKRSEILRNFVKENNQLIGVDNQQADSLKVTADYTNPDGNISYAHLEQSINGFPVFRGEIKAGFTRNGEMFRVINNLAPGLDYSRLAADFRNPLDAVKSAAKTINYELRSGDVAQNNAASTDLKTVFGTGDWATTAEKMYFPTEPGVAVPAWRVLIWEPVSAYYVIVDAETGTMLWRKNITNDQTQSATYNVYSNTTNMMKTLPNPAPIVPGIIDPGLGTQGAIVPRTNVTLIGNEGVLSFNNNGWMTDGTNGVNGTTDGNALEAGLDIDGANGVDLTGKADGTARVFSFAYNPGPGNPAPGDAPTLPAYRNGAVTQLFYINNRYHDEMYQLGFTEAARNFQASNFGRGGAELDRVSGEAQDSSGTNNANFATPADGGRGRMQMYIFTGPTPDYDGDIDADIVIHEHTHGLSNRLIGNSGGLTNNRGGSMGEGWSDFYGLALVSNPADPAAAVYSTGSWATYLLTATYTYNYYYGIRRFPYAIRSFTGGPGNLPHSPQTFADIDPAQINNADGAFARNPTFSNTATEVHNAGEIWCVALWEVRNRFIVRLGGATGNRKTLQLVTDGMKLTPNSPNFIQARNAIISAAAASAASPEASADVVDVREGFRIRGMGFSAVDNNTSVVEAFDQPNVLLTNPFSVSDSTGDNDGFPEPGENVLLSVAVTNTTGATVNSVTANVNGGTNVNYGNIADGATVAMNIPYTVPAGAVCGSLHQVTINLASAVGTQTPQIREFRLGAPVGGAPATFTNSTALTIPDSGVTVPYGTTIAVSGLTGNKLMKLEITGITHTFPGDLDFLLVGPGGTTKYIGLSDSGGGGDVTNLTFTLSDAAAAQPSTSQWVAGDFKPYNSGANDAFAAPAPAAPYTNAAPGGTDTFTSVFGTAGTGLNGTWSLYIVDDAGGDVGTMAGWKLTFESNDYTCSLVSSIKSRADFDGDGKTDLSVFRPSEGNWYLNRSTAGFAALKWGVSTDTLVPGDYDGDGKADTAIFRPDAGVGTPDYFVLNSAGFVFSGVSWGIPGDIPISGDYNGDGKTDFAVFRPSTSVWYILNSTSGSNTIEPFGLTGDVPIAIDDNGDGKTNLAIFRPSSNTWYIAKPTGVPATSFDAYPFGSVGDLLVPADYDNDNKDDIAVFRPSTGQWVVRRSSTGVTTFTSWGASGDVPVPGDYDGDGADDLAVYRNGTWWLNRSTAGVVATPFGLATDKPIPKAYIP